VEESVTTDATETSTEVEAVEGTKHIDNDVSTEETKEVKSDIIAEEADQITKKVIEDDPKVAIDEPSSSGCDTDAKTEADEKAATAIIDNVEESVTAEALDTPSAESKEANTFGSNKDVSSQSKDKDDVEKHTNANDNEPLTMGNAYYDNDNIPQPTKAVRSYSSNLSKGMEDVDLDDSDQQKETTPTPPLVRAFNGTLNGISPGTRNSMAFSFKDAGENEAFEFVTSSLRETLGDVAKDVSDDTLSRYIGWKPDVNRAAARFRAYNKFREENSYIYDGKPLLLSQDPKLTFLIQNGMVIAPSELFAKDGSAVVILRAAKCNVSSVHDCDDHDVSRAIFYILQKVVERDSLDPLKGISIVLDLVGVARKNVPRRLSSLLSKAAGCFPLRIQAIYVVAMPWWFPAGHKKLFSIKMRSRVHFLKDKAALLEFIEKDRLLEEDGGIYNFDLQSWVAATVLNEVESQND